MEPKLHFLEYLVLMKVNQSIKRAVSINHDKYHSNGPLKILLIGYSGKNNTGAEVRAAETIKQIKGLGLPFKVEFGVLTLNSERSMPFYPHDVKFIKISSVFFKDLIKSCSEYHLGLLVEGSCLTSVTSNMAALFFICASGIFRAQNKLCIGYGVEGGPMPKRVAKAAGKYCANSPFVARTKNSLQRFTNLGINAVLGTDTAWTVDAASDEWAETELLRRFGINGSVPLFGISPMNPFIRPIRPDLYRYLLSKVTQKWHSHYDKFYFYTTSKERNKRYQSYLFAIQKSVRQLLLLCENAVPVYIEMEPMDNDTVTDLKRLIGIDGPVLSAKDYNGMELTALLRRLSMLITSRYHAHVLSLPVGVPCVAISKDSRLTDIFLENGLADYCISSSDNCLLEKLPEICTLAFHNRQSIREKLMQRFPEYLSSQEQMGQFLRQVILHYTQQYI